MKINLNLKKIIKWLIFLLLLLVILFFVIGSFLPQPPFKQIPIPEPRVQELRRWTINNQPMIEKTYTFYGLNGLGYYQKELEKEEKKPTAEELAKQDPEAAKLSPLEIEEKVKDQNKITLYQSRLKTQQEPTDILPFQKQPFGDWKETDNLRPFEDDGVFRKATALDSLLFLYLKNFKINPGLGKRAIGEFSFDYQGPQYLLEEDKDYYIGNANLYYSNENERFYNRKTYHLHFNPVRNTLSVYTEKFNVNK
ncbi:hypothetical protein ['Cynodon dactylon' phytoplasma]|uniref:hypothetical protein n=1 Tax='Cynodon dactylon' phytoplasma TaxID=295320 RepID=UPI001265B004|nr:hypothetical protein ['Cynodon dactylon' phytoplasma]KAB8121688.1 hypothetical protein F1741_02115 ['Cynodon dactylon' phytoplasma]